MNINAKQKNVLQIITKYPNAANDEPLLLVKYWEEIDGWDNSHDLHWNLQRVTRPETITRRRRELHNMGLIGYSKEAEEQRTEAFINERDYAAVSWLDLEEC